MTNRDRRTLEKIARNTEPKAEVSKEAERIIYYTRASEDAFPTLTVPQNEVWRIRMVNIYCASATRAGNLYIRYSFKDGGNTYCFADANGANDQVTATFYIGASSRELSIATGVGTWTDEITSLPDILLVDGDRLIMGWALAGVAPGTVAVPITVIYDRYKKVAL